MHPLTIVQRFFLLPVNGEERFFWPRHVDGPGGAYGRGDDRRARKLGDYRVAPTGEVTSYG
jgi:hypothetical protein